jgi:hypothetical protein
MQPDYIRRIRPESVLQTQCSWARFSDTPNSQPCVRISRQMSNTAFGFGTHRALGWDNYQIREFDPVALALERGTRMCGKVVRAGDQAE